MKKTAPLEDTRDRPFAFFDLPAFAALVPAGAADVQTVALEQNTSLPDKLLSGIKWTFLYAPGVAAIHMIMMGFALSVFYKDFFVEMLLGSFGAGTIYTFMIMLGIGRLASLRYLRVVGVVSGVSAIAAILYSISIVLIRGDYFGRFALVTMLLSILAGVLEKRKIDRETA